MHNTKCSKKNFVYIRRLSTFYKVKFLLNFYIWKKNQEIQLKMLFRENCSEVAVENFKKTDSSTPV